MTIKQIKSSRIPNHCIVVLSNNSYLRLNLDIVVQFNLKQGMDMADELLSDLNKNQRLLEVKQKAYNAACRRPMSQFEMVQKLKLKGFDNGEISLALDFLNEFGLVDDAKFAELFVKNYLLRKPVGQAKVLQELLKRGINKDLAKSTINRCYPDDSIAIAIKFADKKLRLISGKDKDKKKQALYLSLQRQGFTFDVIRAVISQINFD